MAKVSEFASAGLSNFDVANLCNVGYIERIRHGYYQLVKKEDIKEEQIFAHFFQKALFALSLRCFIMDTVILHQDNVLSLFQEHWHQNG
ncbi:type IV toxin-antitoxin system AbiEi family antitoxin domain-containing protein [Petralouisia muris]|uniref:type IV toxin-antitoxin system AbiEi family antitoxin domain-containing protein n=1 Tax=Petralouisia muris TaxID=3032872 RepID=UPI0038CD2E88